MILSVENSKYSTNKKKTIRTNKWIQQNNRIQSQHTKISCIPLHKQWIIWKFKTIPFTIASQRIKHSEINQRDERLVRTCTIKTLLKEIEDDK